METHALRDVVSRFVARFNTRDLDSAMAFFAEDAEYVTLSGKVRRGRAQIRAEFEPQFRDRYGHMHFAVERTAVDPSLGTAAITWICSHVFDGPLPSDLRDRLICAGLKAAFGQRVSWRGGDFFCFDAALKIVRKETFAHAPRMGFSLGA
ncbi:MAG: hypothetical protein RL385_4165 [Pseudomonadota bacterium]|jgi:uncharacterized protein (TIGR02246 family)